MIVYTVALIRRSTRVLIECASLHDALDELQLGRRNSYTCTLRAWRYENQKAWELS